MKGIRINMKKIKNNLLSLRIILKELEYKHVFAWITLIFFVAILTPCITWLYKLLIDYFSHENTSPVNIILLVVIYVIAQFLQESIENLQSNFAVKLNYRLNNRINYVINKKLSVIRAELYEDKAVFDLISRVRENITFETINTFGNVLALFMMIITTIMEIRNLLLRLNQEKGTTILISTHILSELHLLATSYGILSKGTLVKQMTAKELDEACEKYLEIEVDDSAKALDILEKNFASICTETVGIGKLIIRNYDQETARLLLILSKNGVQVKNMQNVTETLEEYYSKLI